MTRSRESSQLGLTLVEFLIALAILGIVVTAIVGIWFSTSRAFQTGDSIAEAQANARRAMAVLERELRSASRATVNLDVDVDGDGFADPNALEFSTYLPGAIALSDVRYYVNSDLQLIRASDGSERAVATNVPELRVIDATAEYITVQLLVSVRDLDASLRTQVAFRNP